MKKLVIYGAGNYCRLLFSGNQLVSWQIVGVVDGDPRKWGSTIEQYTIEKPEAIVDMSYDKILITAKAYQSIAECLVLEFKIQEKDILYFDYIHNQMYGLEHSGLCLHKDGIALRERILFRQLACETIQEGLLFEALKNGEFIGYRKIVVAGKKEEHQIVCDFFSKVYGDKIEIQTIDDKKVILPDEKYILTSSDYMKELEYLKRQKGYISKQCLILPLFDVKDTVVL